MLAMFMGYVSLVEQPVDILPWALKHPVRCYYYWNRFYNNSFVKILFTISMQFCFEMVVRTNEGYILP